MGYGYSYGYGYGSGYGYSYGYSSPPPPPTPISPSPPVLPPPPCPSLSKPASPPPPVPDSASPPPSSPPPVPVPSSPLPPVPSSPPPASYPPPVPSSPPPPVPVSQPPLASPPLVPSSSPPFKTVKPHVELYYSPPPPIQPASPPPALPPVSTEPYMSPPPPPLAPSAPPPLPKSPPPLAPKSLPPVSKSPSPLAPKSPPPVSASPPLAPTASPPVSSPVTSPVPPPSSNPYTPPAPVATYTPPPPKRLPYFSPPPPKAPTRPGAVNPNANNTSQNIVISREAAAAIVVVAGLVTLSFVGAAFWFVKQRRRPETEEPIRHMRNFMPSPTVGSQFSEATSAAGPSGSRGTFPFPPRPPSTTHTHNPYSPSDPNLPPSKQYFTYADLLTFTSNFAPSHLLGEGGFGCVYSGVLPDGRRVAVKKLRESGGQGDREFKTEVDIISRVHHRHLVSLVGCCVDEGERLLVYDYVDNDTLYYHLHRNGGTVLSWSLRVKIAAGAARGIAYLHEDCHPRIIHRDIKSSNILIDNNFEAQVSDFGLARLAMDANSQVTTRVMGTFGYLAPEYALSGKLTAKSDVYSFGVVLLELITGRKPVDSSQPLGDESLVEWAKPYLVRALENRDFGELPDPRLEGKYDETEMHRMIEAAAACVRHSSSMRPRMAQVVRALDSLVSDTNLTNGIPPGQSEIFEPQTEEIRMFQMREFGDCSSELSQVSSRRQRDL